MNSREECLKRLYLAAFYMIEEERKVADPCKELILACETAKHYAWAGIHPGDRKPRDYKRGMK